MAVTATFNPITGRLTINGDALTNNLQISRNLAGTIFINGGAVAITGGVPTVGNTLLIEVFEFGSNSDVSLDETNGPLPPALFFGGTGNDGLSGGSAADELRGEAGGDTLSGRGGDDVLIGGADDDGLLGGDGNDRIVWNVDDGHDVGDGQGGIDTAEVNGNAEGESYSIGLSTTAGAAGLFRTGFEFAAFHGVERVEFRPGGGLDTITINDFSSTPVDEVIIDLAGTPGGTTGDGMLDQVLIFGNVGRDFITASSTNGILKVAGLGGPVTILHADVNDRLTLFGSNGNDVIDASRVTPGLITLDIQDSLGEDVIIGSPGDDQVFLGGGNDVAFLGEGNDLVGWNPNGGDDIIDGGLGFDTLLFTGENGTDDMGIVAVNGLARVARTTPGVNLETNDIEKIRVRLGTGLDGIAIGDLSLTDVRQVELDLGPLTSFGTDLVSDNVFVQGNEAGNGVAVARIGATIVVRGLAAQVTIEDADAIDGVILRGFGGNDSLNAKGLAATAIGVALQGGDGNDTLTGSKAANLIDGGAGDDAFVFGKGDGADTIGDFTAGGSVDELHIRGFAGVRTGADVVALASQAGADTLIDFGGGDQVMLTGVTAAALTAADFVVQSSVHNDLGLNGQGDVLFRHDNGSLVAWLLNGVSGFASQSLGTVETAWRIAETGDVNRDSVTDILWRHTDGTVVAWLMGAAGGIGATQTLGAPDNTWRIAETGDFNRDGRSDILWRNNDGTVVAWLMNETSGMLTQTVGNPGTAWHINATGDVNGDGRDDIIWRHDDGSVVAWLMDETSTFATLALGAPDGSWRIEDTGDFNADGRDDLLWRNADGTVVAWLMNAIGGFATVSLGAPDASWQITGAGDFDGDARDDILWRNTDGRVLAWLLDGNGGFGSSVLGAPEAAWRIQNDPTGIT